MQLMVQRTEVEDLAPSNAVLLMQQLIDTDAVRMNLTLPTPAWLRSES